MQNVVSTDESVFGDVGADDMITSSCIVMNVDRSITGNNTCGVTTCDFVSSRLKNRSGTR